MAALSELFTQDIQWHEAGGASSPIAGDYKGQEAVFTMFGQLIELTNGQFSVTVIDCIADDHQAVAIHETSARRGLHTYDSREAIVFHLLEGKVTDAWHTVPDVAAYDLFFSDEPLPGQIDHVANIKKGYKAFQEGDLATVLELISEDAVWHVNLGSKRDGDYVGRDNVLALLAQNAQDYDAPPTFEIHEVLANDTHATVLLTATSVVNGVTFTDREVHIYHLQGEQATECWLATTDVPTTVEAIAAVEKRPTEAQVRSGYEAFATGDMTALTELISPDVVWNVVGDYALAGVKRGRDEVFAYFGQLVQETGGTLKLEVEDICCSADRSSTIVNATATRNGKTATIRQVHVARYVDGTLVEFTAYPEDPAAETAFWS